MSKYSLFNQDVNGSFFNIESVWIGMKSVEIRKQVGMLLPSLLPEIIQGETLNFYEDNRLARTFSKKCAKKVTSNKKFLAKVKKETKKIVSEIDEFSRKYVFQIDKLSSSEIVKVLIRSRKLGSELAMWGTVVAFADLFGDVSEEIMDIFNKRKNILHSADYYMDAFSLSNSMTMDAYSDILKLKSDAAIFKKYFWLDQGYIGRGLTTEELEGIRKHNKEIKVKKGISRAKVLDELKLNKRELEILEASSDMVEIKSLRGDARQFLCVLNNRIMDRLAKEWNVPAKYLSTSYAIEMVEVITKKKGVPEDLAERWRHSVVPPKNIDSYEFITGEKNVLDFLKKNIEITKTEKTDTLYGQTAQSGKVSGKAKLVFGPEDNGKVEIGDILVSVVTSPQLLPAMKKASAFITDMGGITSHAAIVAREMKTPCIVGTKNATKFLKDGDMVEVDADKGVVKILKKV